MNVGTGRVEQKKANRLIEESSPYLLQHAYNPVDWFPWSQEAFQKARQEDKPVFLSIGYSACHWCHVMERESFSDKKIAQILNERFISIKVDREQRPDIDSIYVDAVTLMTGRAGWPLSVFLTADGAPFYGGTYFPPTDSSGLPGFERILLAVSGAWKNKRQELLSSTDTINKLLAQSNQLAEKKTLSVDLLQNGFTRLEEVFDDLYGGFSQAPKFPQSGHLSMLLRYWFRTGSRKALDMVETTLAAMAKGGIYDHLGGGFHRYATDRQWLVPHFEKMLCDQAVLAENYIEAYQVTGKQSYADAARGIFDYVLRDMKDDANGFRSDEDADSQGGEGRFYTWQRSEIENLLGVQNAEIFSRYYGLTDEGNFEDGQNILHVASSVKDLAKKFSRGSAEIEDILKNSRSKLFDHRSKRIRPHCDDKVITSWNALMISSLAFGGAVLREGKYVKAAEKAVDFILSTLQKDGRLMRYYRAGRVVDRGFLDDYANLILALLSLYEAAFDADWLIEAGNLADEMINLFGDDQSGAFFQTGKDAETLIVRYKPIYDGPVPSGNSAAALALLKLGRLTNEKRFIQRGEKVLDAFSGQLSMSPLSLTAMLVALDFWLGPSQEIVIAGSRGQAGTQDFLRTAHSYFLPHAVLHFHSAGQAGKPVESLNRFLHGQVPINGKAAAYICENYTCRKPLTGVDEFATELRKMAKI